METTETSPQDPPLCGIPGSGGTEDTGSNQDQEKQRLAHPDPRSESHYDISPPNEYSGNSFSLSAYFVTLP